MDKYPQEKRRFYRHPVSVPIQYHESQSRRFEGSSSVDLSEGGICFLAERFLAKGAGVNLKIPVGDTVFEVQGQIAYCSRVATLNMYRTGVQFSDATSAFRAKLAEQMLKIKEYKKHLEDEGKNMSEEEAARQWIAKHAKHFSSLF